MSLGRPTRAIHAGSGGNTEEITPMQALIATLNELPDRIDQAASQFKQIYPDGEFNIDITISIKSNTKAKDPLSLSLGEKSTKSKGLADSPTADVQMPESLADSSSIGPQTSDSPTIVPPVK